MIQYEDLFIKICDDFHNEINPLLIEIEPSTKQEFWFERKSINGKFYIIKDLLLSLNASESKQYQLIQLKNILELYKIRVTEYFKTYDFATCFVYNSPEDMLKTKNYFDSIKNYFINFYHDFSTSFDSNSSEDILKTKKYFDSFEDYLNYAYHSNEFAHIIMTSPGMIGFPNDCSYKFSAKLKNNEIMIDSKWDPMFTIEIEKGKQIGSTLRTRNEQDEIEIYHTKKSIPDCDNYTWEKGSQNSLKFKEFAGETHLLLKELLENFDCCNDLCNSLIDSIMNDTPLQNLQELERIYSVLKVTYIKDSFEKFLLIFNPNYSGEKLTWLKSGPELKYFIDQLNGRLKISDEINKWAGMRIEMNTSVKDLSIYLRKQTTKGEYQLLNQGNRKKDPLFKLFREH